MLKLSEAASTLPPLNLNGIALPEFSEEEQQLRTLDFKADECLQILGLEENGLDFLQKQGSFAFRGIDKAVADYLRVKVNSFPNKDQIIRTVAEKDWSEIADGSSLKFALREMIVKINRLKYELVQKWVAENPNTGLTKVAEAEFGNLQPAFAAIDQMFLKIASTKYPISWEERSKRGLTDECAVVRQIGDKIVEVPYHEAFPDETEMITEAYWSLISELELQVETYENDREKQLLTAKIKYYRAVARAFETSKKSDWLKADELLPSQIVDSSDVIHIHPIEPQYMEDRILRAPGLSLRPPDLEQIEAQRLCDNTKETMIASLQSRFFEDCPAAAETLPLVQRSNSALRHFFGAGMEMDLKPAGQILPNEAEQRIQGGVDSSLDMETAVQRFPIARDAFIKVFSETEFKKTLESRIDFNDLIGTDVASHEFGHAVGLLPDTYERLGGKDFVNTMIEEWKATAGGFVLNYVIPFLEGKLDIEELRTFVARHLMNACRYAKIRQNPSAAAYTRKSMMLLSAMERSNIIFNSYDGVHDDSDSWHIDLRDNEIKVFAALVFAQYKEVLRIYGEGDKHQLAAFLMRELQPTEFINYVFNKLPVPDAEKFTAAELAKLPNNLADEPESAKEIDNIQAHINTTDMKIQEVLFQ